MSTVSLKPLLATLTLLTLMMLAPVVHAQRGTSVVRRITFPRGQTSVEVEGSLRRGVSHDYLIRARRGQGIAVRIMAQGDVGFQIITPSGQYLSGVTVEWTSRLPESGDYRINILPDTTTTKWLRYTLEVIIE